MMLVEVRALFTKFMNHRSALLGVRGHVEAFPFRTPSTDDRLT